MLTVLLVAQVIITIAMIGIIMIQRSSSDGLSALVAVGHQAVVASSLAAQLQQH